MIDKNEFTTLLPNLPEVAGERLNSKDISRAITDLLPSSVKFINEEIININFHNKTIITNIAQYTYDHLILASGSTTNFYGFNQNMDKIHVLDNLKASEEIKVSFNEYLDINDNATLVISGAGFTGIELGYNLYYLAKRRGKKLKVIFVEVAKRVLPMLSEKSTNHVMAKLNKLSFKIYTDNKIIAFDGNNITLKDDEAIKDVFFCWCSGVKSTLTPEGNYESLPEGRFIVNEFLQIPNHPEVYVAGDAAAMKDKEGKFMRRVVNFAQMAGKHAANNLISIQNNKEQKPFNPLDLGWVIPIYISSVGEAMGVEVTGRKGIFMHYIICGMKNYSLKNFGKEFKEAVKYPFAKP